MEQIIEESDQAKGAQRSMHRWGSGERTGMCNSEGMGIYVSL